MIDDSELPERPDYDEKVKSFLAKIIDNVHPHYTSYLLGLLDGFYNIGHKFPVYVVLSKIDKSLFKDHVVSLYHLDITGVSVKNLNIDKLTDINYIGFLDKPVYLTSKEDYKQKTDEHPDKIVLTSRGEDEELTSDEMNAVLVKIAPHLLASLIIAIGEDRDQSFIFSLTANLLRHDKNEEQ